MDPATLRHFKTKTSIKAMGIATIISTLVTGVCLYVYVDKKITPVRKFYSSYDPELEWKVLLNSGILKTVDKDGNLIDLSD